MGRGSTMAISKFQAAVRATAFAAFCIVPLVAVPGNAAAQDTIQSTWRQIASEHDLSYKALHDVDRVFGFLDGMMLQSYSLYFRYVQCLLFCVQSRHLQEVLADVF